MQSIPAPLAATASGQEWDALRRSFAALLLYHQILTAGLSVQQFAARYDAPSALGPSIGKVMEIDVSAPGLALPYGCAAAAAVGAAAAAAASLCEAGVCSAWYAPLATASRGWRASAGTLQ